MSENFELGQIVTGIYKTGKYIGEVTAIKPAHYTIRVKAVLKHPTQGDLHNPKEAHVPLFHERRALANGEQTNIVKSHVKVFEGDVPEYKDSLKQALDEQKKELSEEGSEWAKRSLLNLEDLEKDYFKS